MIRYLSVLFARHTPAFIKRLVHGNRGMDRFARKAFAFLALRGGNTATIEHGPMKGMVLALSEHITHAHIGGVYELDTQQAIDRLVKPGFICYDLGASIGYLSLLMARKAAHVYAFEPAPHAATEISRQAAANGFQNIAVVSIPVSDQERKVTFSVTDGASGSRIVESETKWPTLELTAISLDAFVRSNPFPDFVKIDVEGEEGRVLRGARSILEKGKTIFCCELHSRQQAEEVETELASHGYTMKTLAGEPFAISGPVVAGLVQIIALPVTETARR